MEQYQYRVGEKRDSALHFQRARVVSVAVCIVKMLLQRQFQPGDAIFTREALSSLQPAKLVCSSEHTVEVVW